MGMVHSAVLVNESPWRKALSEYQEKRYPYYLPAPQDVAEEMGFEDRIAAAKRVVNQFLASSICNINFDNLDCPSESTAVEWNRLLWQSVSKIKELWPVTLGKQARPRKLQGRLRRELEPYIWVRVDVQRRYWKHPLQQNGEQGEISSMKREPFVRCRRFNDQIEYHDEDLSQADSSAPSPDSDVRNLLSLLGSQPLLSSKSLLLLPPLNSFPHGARSRVPHQLGMVPLMRTDGGGMAIPKSWLVAPVNRYTMNDGRREHWGESKEESLEAEWLREHRITLMLGTCEV